MILLDNDLQMTVTGIMKNLPRTSSMKFAGLTSMETAQALPIALDDWAENRATTFVMLADGVDKTEIENKLPGFIGRHFAETEETPEQMYLFPLFDFRLRGDHITTFIATAPAASTYIFFSVGILLLLVVCINFINMSIARHMYRTKEISTQLVEPGRLPVMKAC